jgi:hypothetical protein
MDSKFIPAQFRSAIVAVLVAVVLVLPSAPLHVRAQGVSLDPAKMPRISTVDERFASYNIEMAEVTGGNFWKPYHSQISWVLAPLARGRSRSKWAECCIVKTC